MPIMCYKAIKDQTLKEKGLEWSLNVLSLLLLDIGSKEESRKRVGRGEQDEESVNEVILTSLPFLAIKRKSC